VRDRARRIGFGAYPASTQREREGRCFAVSPKQVQIGLEYAPQPPFNSGQPETAPPEVMDAVTVRMAPSRAQRRARLEAWVAARHE
jgi:hypothetical protein